MLILPTLRLRGMGLCLALIGVSACSDEPAANQSDQASGTAIASKAPAAQSSAGKGVDSAGGAAAEGADGWVQEIVNSEQDQLNQEYWGEEIASNELIAGPLRQLRRRLLGDSVPLGPLFTESAQIADPSAAEFDEVEVSPGVARRSWKGEQELLGIAAWDAAITEKIANCARVRWTLLKPAQVSFGPKGRDSLQVQLKWRFNAEKKDGGLLHESGMWISHWERHGEDWLCSLLKPEPGMTSLVSSAPHFVDVTLESFKDTPLDPRLPNTGGSTHRIGSSNRGLALIDLDKDDDLDLVLSLPNRVLFNRGDGTFEDREATGVVPEMGYYGVLAADFDRDGDVDLVYSGNGELPLFYRSDGKGHWEREELDALKSRIIASSLAAHDVDGDGWLDIFFCGYGPFINPGPPDPSNATNGSKNQVLRGGPEGFEDVTEAWGFDAESTRWAFSAAFADADEDGDVDVFVANDFGPNTLYLREAGEDVHFVAQVEDPDKINSGFSMSATWGDLDGDLDLDLYVSNMASTAAKRIAAMPGDPNQGGKIDAMRRKMSKGNTIVLAQNGQLTEAADERGARAASWAWGTALFDYDADGDLDIQCLNGFWSNAADDGRDL